MHEFAQLAQIVRERLAAQGLTSCVPVTFGSKYIRTKRLANQ